MLSEEERLAWIVLSQSENVGPITFRDLIDYFKKPSEALKYINDFALKGGRKKPIRVGSKKQALEELKKAEEQNVSLLFSCDEAYPKLLKEIEDKPPILYAKGFLSLLKETCIGVVGNRNASLNGKFMASKFGYELAKEGYVAVSGMAKGIDAAVHEGALKTGAVPAFTIAVMGTGMDVCYPSENKKLKEDLEAKALVLSEFPFGVKPHPTNFPKRNRIISGLSKGVVVIEAQIRSGSLITSRLALEQSREVFAVPGSPLDPRSEGCNKLIKQGAFLAESVKDVLEELDKTPPLTLFDVVNKNEYKADSIQFDEDALKEVRTAVLQNLNVNGVSIDRLIRECSLPIPLVNVVLTELELAGKISRSAGNRVFLRAEALEEK